MSDTEKSLCQAVGKAAQTLNRVRAAKMEGYVEGYVAALKDGGIDDTADDEDEKRDLRQDSR